MNPAAAKLLGWEPEAMIGLAEHEVVYRGPAAGAMSSPAAPGSTDGLQPTTEGVFWRKDGSPLPVEYVRAPISDRGQVTGVVVSFTDVSARKEAAEALRAQKEQLQLVLDTTPHLVFVKDWDGRFVLVNKAIADVYGTTPAQLVGKTDADFNPNPEEVERFLRADRAVMSSGLPQVIPEEAVTNATTGEVRWYETIKVPFVAGEGQSPQVLGVATDITERKRVEEALEQSEEQLRQAQKMDAIGQLAGGVAHDFNNLLTVINGCSSALLQRVAGHEALSGPVAEIARAGQRAAALTYQLLAFSRRQVLTPEVLDLNAVAADSEKLLRRLIGEDIELVTVLRPALGSVRVDPGQLQQVILNLAVNARDAMPQGGTLTIETAKAELDEAYARDHPGVEPGQYVMLAVSDTGCGMDAATRSRIFEPFFTTKEPGKGTGLGLATVYGIVKQSGGHVWVYSEPGLGTTFKIYLPRVAAAAEAPARPSLPEPAPGGSETIRLVEDEDQVRALVRGVLEEAGYRVLVAGRGDEALRVAAEHVGPLDLLLTDVVMPGMSGRELAARLSGRRADLRVLYMSVTLTTRSSTTGCWTLAWC